MNCLVHLIVYYISPQIIFLDVAVPLLFQKSCLRSENGSAGPCHSGVCHYKSDIHHCNSTTSMKIIDLSHCVKMFQEYQRSE
jgi:hypothetical protein